MLLALLAVAAVLVGAPHVHDRWQERSAIRAFQTDLAALEIARQDQLLKGISPLDKGRTPADDLALQHWLFTETHALVRRHLKTDAPAFAKYLRLLDGVYQRTLRFGARAGRLAELQQQLADLHLHQIADPERTELAIRAASEARHISTTLRRELVAHHEYARQAIAHSGLDDVSRAAVWRVADDAYIGQLATVDTVERWGPELGRIERLLQFFDHNREGYEIDPRYGLRFRDPSTEIRFMQLMRTLRDEARVQ